MNLHLAETGSNDLLPSWNEGAAKHALLEFIQRVSAEDSSEQVPPAERVAVFGGTGVLWPGKPYIEAHFSLTRIKSAAQRDPSLGAFQPFALALAGDLHALSELPVTSALELISRSHMDMSHEEFAQSAAEFMESAVHPRLGLAWCELAYAPMRELLELLRARGFQVWICSADAHDLARSTAARLYGLAPHQVMGSTVREELRETASECVIWRGPELATINDHEQRVLAFAQRVGQRPLLTVGSLHDAGDMPILRYSRVSQRPSCQVLLRHDDAEREMDYEEAGMTPEAAQDQGALVLSVKQDWKRVFGPQVRKLTIDLAQVAAPTTTIALAHSPPPADKEG